jgi:tripeptide aminopeptidase
MGVAVINQARLISSFMDLIRIDSPSGGEGKTAEVVAARLRALGLEPRTDALFNVTTRVEGRGEPILLNAHMDSVAPCLGIQPIIEGDLIKSDGNTVLGADDRAGVAAILEALAVIIEQNLDHRSLEVVITAREETGLFGAKGLDLTSFRSKMGVVLDARGPVGTIIFQTPSHDNFEATIYGKAAHAGAEPEKGISAIVVAAEAIAEMRLGRIDSETTANIGIIKGGVAANIVTEKCELIGEARSRRESKLTRQTNAMTRALKRAATKHKARVDVQVARAYSGFRFRKRDPIIQYVSQAIARIGREPQLKASGGGSDANVFNANGIACVPISIGYEMVHTRQEHIAISELHKAAELVVQLTSC